jgi:hypothetical protein
MTQTLPFVEPPFMVAHEAFERPAYAGQDSGAAAAAAAEVVDVELTELHEMPRRREPRASVA